MKVGEVLDGRYELIEMIGHGGMGEVWKARDLSTAADRHDVALKILHSHLLIENELLARFLREAKGALEARYSAHVIEVLDVVHLPNRSPYLVMEHLEGENLLQIVNREGPLEVKRAVNLILQTCEALDEVHRQDLVHRDVKPDNIFVTRLSGGEEWIKLLDFGVVKFSAIAASAPRLTNVGSTIGTPQYMAPEQAMAPDKIDHRVDIYGVGAVLYQLLTGHRPYETDDFQEILLRIARKELIPPRHYRPDLGQGLESVVLRAMAMNPEDRYETMLDLNLALQPFSATAHRRGSSTIKTIIEEIPKSIAASFLSGQIDTEPAIQIGGRGGVLESFGDNKVEELSSSEILSESQETEIIELVSEKSSQPTDRDRYTPTSKLNTIARVMEVIEPEGTEATFIEPSEPEGTEATFIEPSKELEPVQYPVGPPFGQSTGDQSLFNTNGREASHATLTGADARQEPSTEQVIASAHDTVRRRRGSRYAELVARLRTLFTETGDRLSSALPWLDLRWGLLLAVGALIIGGMFVTLLSFGVSCLLAHDRERAQWAALISSEEHDGGEDMVFDAGLDEMSDAWEDEGSEIEDVDVEAEDEVVDHYGGLERREVISALRSLGPSVGKCLRRSRRRPGSHVKIHFWVHKSGVIAFRRSRPPIHRSAQQCLRRSTRGRRLPRPPQEPFVAIYPYVVPR